MKKQFAKLSKAEQEKVELEYHQMKPEDFEKELSRVKRRTHASLSSVAKRKSKTTAKRRAA